MRVAVLQSSYLPWKGYFDIIHSVDAFVFYDDVQYTARDWRNRNRFKFSGGTTWLTIPCGHSRNRLICEVALKDPSWQRQHWRAIRGNYRKHRCFSAYEDFFEDFFMSRTWTSLSDLNQYAIRNISKKFLRIDTEFHDSRRFSPSGSKTARLLSVLKNFDSSVGTYISGPSAKGYLDEELFHQAGIAVEYFDYSGYPEYPQKFPPFEHDVSILDLLFNVGDQAPDYIWGWREPVAGSASR